MKKAIVSLSLLALTTFACTKKNKPAPVDSAAPAAQEKTMNESQSETSATSSETSSAAAPIVNAAAACANGAQPKILKGDCSGEWAVTKTQEGTSCNFNWGPTIKCPEGTKDQNYEAVCYGTTAKPAKATVTEAAQCEKQFGKSPSKATYELTCCPV